MFWSSPRATSVQLNLSDPLLIMRRLLFTSFLWRWLKEPAFVFAFTHSLLVQMTAGTTTPLWLTILCLSHIHPQTDSIPFNEALYIAAHWWAGWKTGERSWATNPRTEHNDAQHSHVWRWCVGRSAPTHTLAQADVYEMSDVRPSSDQAWLLLTIRVWQMFSVRFNSASFQL